MRSISIFYLSNQSNCSQELIDVCIGDCAKFKNKSLSSIIDKIDDNSFVCYFYSKKCKKEREKIIIRFVKFDLTINENITKAIKQLIINSYNEAENISVEPMGKLTNNIVDEIYKKIESKFNKYYSYKNHLFTPNPISKNNLVSIVDLVNEIFCELLNAHLLSNGNKRLSTALMANMLYSFGYYLKFTKGSKNDWVFYEKKISNIVVSYQKSKNMDKTCLISKKIILKNIIVSLNFMNN